MTLELATKTCTKCAETKPLTEFHRNQRHADGLSSSCKECNRADSAQRTARRRAAMGEDAWRSHVAAVVAKHRAKTGNAMGKQYRRDTYAAQQALIDRHRREYEHLLLLARRGELVARNNEKTPA